MHLEIYTEDFLKNITVKHRNTVYVEFTHSIEERYNHSLRYEG